MAMRQSGAKASRSSSAAGSNLRRARRHGGGRGRCGRPERDRCNRGGRCLRPQQVQREVDAAAALVFGDVAQEVGELEGDAEAAGGIESALAVGGSGRGRRRRRGNSPLRWRCRKLTLDQIVRDHGKGAGLHRRPSRREKPGSAPAGMELRADDFGETGEPGRMPSRMAAR